MSTFLEKIKSSRRLHIVLYCILSVSVLLVALEFKFRQIKEENEGLRGRGAFVADAYDGIDIAPNLKNKTIEYNGGKDIFSVTTTADGYRGSTNYSSERDPDTIRIVAVGSSFTFGWLVNDDETWPAQLKQICQKNNLFKKKLEVINLGAPQVGLDIKRYVHEFRKLNPDIVIMQSIPHAPKKSLSIEEILTPRKPTLEGAFFIDFAGFPKRNPTGIWIVDEASKRSALACVSVAKINEWLGNAPVELWASPTTPLTQEMYDKQSPECLNFFLNWKKLLEHDDCLMFVSIRKRKGESAEKRTSLLHKKLIQENIKAIITDVPPAEKFYTVDRHYNAEGNAIVARSIYDLLIENKTLILSKTNK